MLALARSATRGKCDGFLRHRPRQVQWVVLQPHRDGTRTALPHSGGDSLTMWNAVYHHPPFVEKLESHNVD